MKGAAKYLCVFFVLQIFNGFAQQNIPYGDLQKVNDVFLTSTTYYIKSNYSLYKENGTTPIENFSAIVKKKGPNMYYKLGKTEIIINNKRQFFISHDQKIATLNNTYAGDEESLTPQSVKDRIETLKKAGNTVKYFVEANDIGVFKYYMPKNPNPVFELHYNTKTFLMTKMVLYKDYNDIIKNGQTTSEKYKLVIDYSSIDLSDKNILDNDFSFSKYITEVKGNYKLNATYTAYKLFIN